MKIIEINISPEENQSVSAITKIAAKKYGVKAEEISSVKVLRRSLDARKSPRFILKCAVYLHAEKEDAANNALSSSIFSTKIPSVANATPVIVVGAGPAGIFAALELAKLGFKPVVIERGKAVRDRRFDLAALMKRGELNPESNYCFGEGGAGTFSDGKLYTRSGKRGSIENILKTFVAFGAHEDILVDAHPHIGTNKLPKIITAMREYLIACGAEFHFSHKFTALKYKDKKIQGVITSQGSFDAPAVVLASGHSARDVYHYLDSIGLLIQRKGFAVGVRIEHPQEVINKMQYKSSWNSPYLPPASYSLVAQAEEKGVYSFCMCPGGIICPASTDHERLVVNGWSPSTRNSRFANSGMVVEIPEEIFANSKSPLAGLEYQDRIEASAFIAGGGKYKAPAQRVVDFIKDTSPLSATLPECSYGPGVVSAQIDQILPPELHRRLKAGLKNFISRNSNYGSSEAILVGVESRTSSPVRIPRETSGMHPEMQGLFPCGEGGGYAGGIVSAAIDGVSSAEKVTAFLRQ